MVNFTQGKIHYTSCFACDSLDMYNDYVCIYTLDMADYFLVLILTDVLMIWPQLNRSSINVRNLSNLILCVFVFIFCSVDSLKERRRIN